jgi:hypothetical protein
VRVWQQRRSAASFYVREEGACVCVYVYLFVLLSSVLFVFRCFCLLLFSHHLAAVFYFVSRVLF